MPELPEVETIVRGLAPQVVGKTIVASQESGKKLRYPLPDFSQLFGAVITEVTRRAKYLLFHFNNGTTLIWHLGMTGQFHVLSHTEPGIKHEHVILSMSDETTLRYRDTRRFGYAGLCPTSKLAEHPWISKLGPEPLTNEFNGDYLKLQFRNKGSSIKQAIMNNQYVVGVGNIYASESLFRSGIHPARSAKDISSQSYNRLSRNIKTVLLEAIDAGGSTISDFVKADGKPGYFAHSFKVYGREGKPCVACNTAITRIIQGGRASFFCPTCQEK